MSEDLMTNKYLDNLNNQLKLPHHEVLVMSDKSPNIKKKYGNFVRYLVATAKSAETNETYIREIINKTSDAEEQYAMLTIVWKARGLKKANEHKYKKVSPAEVAKIRELYTAGHSIYSIAKYLNRHTSTIYYVLKRLNLK